MTFKEAKEIYYKFTELSSEIIRKFALGGIAIVWIFEDKRTLDPKWKWCLLLFVVCLTIDLFQYIFVSTFYKIKLHQISNKLADLEDKAEKDGKTVSQETIDNYETNPPTFINVVAQIAFYVKAALLLVSYILLVIIFYSIVFPK